LTDEIIEAVEAAAFDQTCLVVCWLSDLLGRYHPAMAKGVMGGELAWRYVRGRLIIEISGSLSVAVRERNGWPVALCAVTIQGPSGRSSKLLLDLIDK
jgi:hypothetical protein